MKLKGDYSGAQTYSVGDVVRYSNGEIYHLQKPCKAGTPPTVTLYWGQLEQTLAQSARMILDLMEIEDAKIEAAVATEDDKIEAAAAAVSATIPKNIGPDAVVLHSSTPDSDKDFIITVDDDGDITATEIEPVSQNDDDPPLEGGE